MTAKPDCIVCLLRQFLQISRMCGQNDDELNNSFFSMLDMTSSLARDMSPPEMAAFFTKKIEESTGIADPYKRIKVASNEAAMKLYPELKERVNKADDSFAEALCLAIAGNLIDFGAKVSLDLHEALREILEQPLFQHIESGDSFNRELFRLADFRTAIESAETILYLGDNAGEIVFDRVFIEALLEEHPEKKITFVVRGGPALNDALLEDVSDVGIDNLVEVMSSGTATAGTVLSNCSAEFLQKLDSTDLVISKGQGNYEALSGEELPPTWFLFRIKCGLVADHAGGPEGSLVLKQNSTEKIRRNVKNASVHF